MRANDFKTGRVALVLFGLTMMAASFSVAAEPLRSIEKIRALSPAMADGHVPVEIEAQVMQCNPAINGFYVFNGQVGIYVRRNPKLKQVSLPPAGAVVRLVGTTVSGGFSPAMRAETVEVIGQKVFPTGRIYRPSDRFADELDCCWVSVRARLISVSQYRDVSVVLVLETEEDHATLYANIPYSPENMALITEKKFRLIEFNAVAGTVYNHQRQMTDRVFFINSADSLRVVPEASGTVKRVEMNELMQFGMGRNQSVRTRGLVTYAGEQEIVLRGDKCCMRVSVENGRALQTGDYVEVEGVPAPEPIGPVFRARRVRILEHRDAPVPVDMSLENTKAEKVWPVSISTAFHEELVQVDAVLVDSGKSFDFGEAPDQARRALLCRGDQYLIKALLPPGMDVPEHVTVGARLRLTGICKLTLSDEKKWQLRITGFGLEVRGPDDVVVLARAPWLTTSRLLMLVGMVSGIALLGFIWGFVLQKVVQRQTGIIGSKIEKESVLTERQRIARELHDNLEQGLAGMTIQLRGCVRLLGLNLSKQVASIQKAETLAAPENVELTAQLEQAEQEVVRDAARSQRAIEVVQGILAHCRSESRASIVDLRSGLLEKMDLPAALRSVLEPLAEECGARLDLQVTGRVRRLKKMAERNVLVMIREAVTNAARHASPDCIEVLLTYREEGLAVRVADDGCGFDMDDLSTSDRFGVLGMHERIKQLGGTIHMQSQSGDGTRIDVELPTAAEWELG